MDGRKRKVFIPLDERFVEFVEEGEVDECWPWKGAIAASGYGVIGSEPEWATGKPRQMLLAHRVSYEFYKCPIPDGLHIDHLCRTRSCINPHHLEAVTNAENNRRGAKATITEKQAAEIKLLTDVPWKAMMKRYDCTRHVISSIREGRTWIDVPAAESFPEWALPFRGLDGRSHRFKDELGKMKHG